MDIINLSISVNIFLSFLVFLLSLYMMRHVVAEYSMVKKLKNGRRALNTILIALFFVMFVDALRGSAIYILHYFGNHSDGLTVMNLFLVDILNLIRVGFLMGFVRVTIEHYTKNKC